MKEFYKSNFPRQKSIEFDSKKPITSNLVRRQLSKSTYNARDTFNKKNLTPDEYTAWKKAKKKSGKKTGVRRPKRSIPTTTEVPVTKSKIKSKATISSEDDSSSSDGESVIKPKVSRAKNNLIDTDKEDDEDSSSETVYDIVAQDADDGKESDTPLLPESPEKKIVARDSDDDSDILLPESPEKRV